MAKLANVKVVNENTVEYNGFVYTLVTGDAKVEDIVKASEQDLDVTEGAFYLVVDIDDDNDIVFKDNVDDSNYFNQGEHSVFRKSHAITIGNLTDAEGVVKIELPDGTRLEGTPSDLEKITRSMQKMQNEQQGQAEQGSSEEMKAEVAAETEPVPERLQVGDYAKVVEEDSHSAKVGDIVKIFVDDKDNQPFKCEDLQGKELRYPWFYKRGLVKATDEEVLEAKQALLKEGDFARIIGGENTEDVCGPHNYETGTIVKLACDCDSDGTFDTRHLNGDEPDAPWVHRKDLEPLTKEETEHIAREAEEEKKAEAEREKWAAIGREVGEIKKGDIVRTTSHCGSVNPVGTIGVARGDSTVDSCSTVALAGDSGNWSSVELIVPVEQRFDTVG
ncbi:MULTISPECIES: hypothetical protein [Bacillus cereus group]|nr:MULTISPECIES: hypothetical protein [Bacillus cereus group]MBG9510948.1 hypothetical protein [Bacillus thuringiensis]MBG9616861.1 hypothetical protein [Bacillus cereus]PGR44723.1 hypothetical protein COC48_30450 [Bacillus thuringiensis]